MHSTTYEIRANLRQSKNAEVILQFQILLWQLLGIILSKVRGISCWEPRHLYQRPQQIKVKYFHHKNFSWSKSGTFLAFILTFAVKSSNAWDLVICDEFFMVIGYLRLRLTAIYKKVV